MRARNAFMLCGAVAATAIVVAARPTPEVSNTTVHVGVGPTMSSIGTLTFGPGGVLYAADPQSATIFAIDLGATATKTVAGSKDIANINTQIA